MTTSQELKLRDRLRTEVLQTIDERSRAEYGHPRRICREDFLTNNYRKNGRKQRVDKRLANTELRLLNGILQQLVSEGVLETRTHFSGYHFSPKFWTVRRLTPDP